MRCTKCPHESLTVDLIEDVGLEIGGCGTVEDALRRFTRDETLEGEYVNQARSTVRI